MVHALRTVNGLLRPSAVLVDIRPLDERAEFLVIDRLAEQLAGLMQETDEGIEYPQAEAAMRQAMSEGLFALEAESPFLFIHHARSFHELRAYLEDIWSDAVMGPELEREAGRLLDAAGPGAEMVLRETGWMRKLRASSARPDLSTSP